ncbi:MAG: phosphatidylserine decarboxylase family protein [Acidobacteria bacterium]|nr:phosphatidylserine decarboxylase family protein [Acidobacteriota bacterium]
MVATGIYYALACIAGGLVITYLTRPLFAIPMFVLAAFFLWFFRDPERQIPAGPHAVSPADGKVVLIREEGPLTRVAVFMSPVDVHVNRSPIAGKITSVKYQPGKFLVASKDEASLENEQNIITVEGDDGVKVTFAQIAGLVARRVICDKRPGDRVAMGDRIGLIQFSSRVDILFGKEWTIAVRPGDRVSAGSSILAKRKN